MGQFYPKAILDAGNSASIPYFTTIATVTSSAPQYIGPFSIEHYEKFILTITNTGTEAIQIRPEVSFDTLGAHFVALTSRSTDITSSVASATGIVTSTPIDGVWKYMRINVSATGGSLLAGIARAYITGRRTN